MKAPAAPLAEVISQGGRAGAVESADDGFRLEFREPSEKIPSGVTPEHLFAGAWAACFHGAVRAIAQQRKQPVEGSTVTARVQRNKEPGSRPFTVELSVSLPGIDEDEARRILSDAHQMCSYSQATRGNVDVKTSTN